jgi:putative DNA primase/helicase
MFDAREIALALGGKRNGFAWIARCPAHADRTPSLSLRDEDGKVLVHCHAGCPQVAVLDALRGRGLWPDTPLNGHPIIREHNPPHNPPRKKDDIEGRIRRALRWWREAEDPRGTLAERYLLSRELVLDENLANHVLRFHRQCLFGQDEAENAVFYPCLVALFRDLSTNRPRAIHRIALAPDGRAHLGKKMLGPTAGCAVKLDDDGEVTRTLNIAEGIETALARYAEGNRPMWALGSSGAIERFPVLHGVESLMVWADNDASMTGFRAAKACVNRWAAAGRKAHGIMPKGLDCDWADERGIR